MVPLNITATFVTGYHGLKTWPLANAIMLLLIVTGKIFLPDEYSKFWRGFVF